jgi:hypothetical protein
MVLEAKIFGVFTCYLGINTGKVSLQPVISIEQVGDLYRVIAHRHMFLSKKNDD